MVKVYKSQLEALIDREDVTRKTEIKRLNESIENYGRRQVKLQNSFLDGDITSVDYNEMKTRIESEISENKITKKSEVCQESF